MFWWPSARSLSTRQSSRFPSPQPSSCPSKNRNTVFCSATYRGDQKVYHRRFIVIPTEARFLARSQSSTFAQRRIVDNAVQCRVRHLLHPVFPLGSLTSFDDYLAKNLSILGDLKARGCVHDLSVWHHTSPLCPRSLIQRPLFRRINTVGRVGDLRKYFT